MDTVPDIITHKLLVFKEARPITQKKRDYDDEKHLVAKAEAEKLLSVGFIREGSVYNLVGQRPYGYQAER